MTDAADHDDLFAALCTELGLCLHAKGQAKVVAALQHHQQHSEGGAQRRWGRLPERAGQPETPGAGLPQGQSAGRRHLAGEGAAARPAQPFLDALMHAPAHLPPFT